MLLIKKIINSLDELWNSSSTYQLTQPYWMCKLIKQKNKRKINTTLLS